MCVLHIQLKTGITTHLMYIQHNQCPCWCLIEQKRELLRGHELLFPSRVFTIPLPVPFRTVSRLIAWPVVPIPSRRSYASPIPHLNTGAVTSSPFTTGILLFQSCDHHGRNFSFCFVFALIPHQLFSHFFFIFLPPYSRRNPDTGSLLIGRLFSPLLLLHGYCMQLWMQQQRGDFAWLLDTTASLLYFLLSRIFPQPFLNKV